jgi:hypothetical protein
LREDVDESTVDAAVPGDDAVAVVLLILEAEVGRAMHDESIEFDKAAFVEEKIESLARGELSFGVLRLDAFFTAALLRFGNTAL